MSTVDQIEQSNSENQPFYRPLALRYGGIGALILIALGLALHLAGITDPASGNQSGNWINSLIQLAVMFGVIFMAVKQHRDQDLGGFIKFGRGFGLGFSVTLVVALITAVWTFLFFTVIEPDLIGEIMDMSKEQIMDQQGVSASEAEEMMKPMSFIFNPVSFTLFGFLGTLFFGLIISLVVAGISQKQPTNA